MESRPQEDQAREGGGARHSSSSGCEAVLPSLLGVEAANDMRMAQLVRAIEQEIIPRLMLAHRTTVEPLEGSGQGSVIGPDEVRHFAKLVLSEDEDAAFQVVVSHRTSGVAIEAIYVDLLAPTARYLGELWTEDLCNFTDVTIGLGRLQRVLRELSPEFGRSDADSSGNRTVLLLPSPQEQHTFGLVMVGEFFRRAGWDVSGGAWTTGADGAALVRNEWFDAIGFSLGAVIHLAALTETVRAVRQASCNPGIVVLVGGPLFAEFPAYVVQVGADGMTMEGRDAPPLAERLIAEHSKTGAVRRAGPSATTSR